VLENRLVLHHRVGDSEIVQCFDANTGDSLWDYSYSTRFEDPYGYNNGPRCSPILTADHCFTLGAEGKLTCVTLETGDLVWQRDLLTDFNIPEGFFGVGASPILEGDRLIVLVGGQPNSGVVAFATSNGATLWESVGQETWGGAPTGWTAEPYYEWQGDEMVVSYSSPVPATIHGKRHILCLMRQGLVSVDPADGHEHFHFWFMSRTHESVNAACPVVVDDTVMISAAYRVGSACLKIGEDGGIADVLWQNERNLLTHWSTAHYLDGHYLGFSGRHENEGALTCIDAVTGDVKWATSGWEDGANLRQRPTGEVYDSVTGETLTAWPYYGRGSAILADGKLFVLGEHGTLALVAADISEWKELARCAAPRMKFPSWTAPVLSHGRLYLRCEDALVCLSLRADQ
jgi:outer membrane protein assembly factor BamB